MVPEVGPLERKTPFVSLLVVLLLLFLPYSSVGKLQWDSLSVRLLKCAKPANNYTKGAEHNNKYVQLSIKLALQKAK